ncbi:hypothetical protein BDW02DRAFT_512728, partial [Decorospora gaudefroyi]
FNVFAIFFKVTFAYSNISLLLRHSSNITLLLEHFSLFSKLVICAIIIYSRY